MLKRRVIPLLLLRDGELVKGRQFGEFRHTGRPLSALRVLTAQDADEIVLLQVGKRKEQDLSEILEFVSKECAVPLSVGGGINSLAKASALLKNGADKVVITSGNWSNPGLVEQIASDFGSQAVIGGIEYRVIDGSPMAHTQGGTQNTGCSVADAAQLLEKSGAGEIFLNSIDRDGMKCGLDLVVTREVCELVGVPVITAGGVGHVEHVVAAFTETSVEGVACGSLFCFGDNTPIRVRSVLRQNNVPVRKVK